eukprot:SAG22_NODE_374_length_11548_cov_6.893615_2_plen_323_part_00
MPTAAGASGGGGGPQGAQVAAGLAAAIGLGVAAWGLYKAADPESAEPEPPPPIDMDAVPAAKAPWRTKLVLWDIDGTLATSQHADGVPAGGPLLAACSEVTGVAIQKGKLSFSGKTDPLIIRELLLANNVEPTADVVHAIMQALPRIMGDGVVDGKFVYLPLPGAIECVAALAAAGEQQQPGRLSSSSSSIVQGMLTGNLEPNASTKLVAAGFAMSSFAKTKDGKLLGAFGSDSQSRNSLLPIALAKYNDTFGGDISEADVVIIGDTPRDIECAHVNGAKALAVATGEYDVGALKEAEWVLADLRDSGTVMSLLMGEAGSVE